MMKKLISALTLSIYLMLIIGCSKDDSEPKFVPGNVIVGFKKEVSLRQAYEFAIQTADSIGTVRGFYFYSNLPLDSLDFVRNYILEAEIEYASVQINSTANKITIIKSYLSYDDKSTLPAWLTLTEEPILQFEDIQAEKSMLLFVSPGTEKAWIKTHVKDTYVRYAELNYYLP